MIEGVGGIVREITGTVIFGEAGIRSIVLPASMRTVPYRLCNNFYLPFNFYKN